MGDSVCVAGAGSGVPNGCGIHVHSGRSCLDDSSVGGHYYSSSLSSDPWSPVVYVAGSSGSAAGDASVDTGTTLSQVAGRAFVVHELSNGARIACGILEVDTAAGESGMLSAGFAAMPSFTFPMAVVFISLSLWPCSSA